MSLILGIETSTKVCSVSLSKDGNLIHALENYEGYSHASHLTVLIEQLFHESEYQLNAIDAVAVSSGPGSYTGLRIGVSTAKGICFALNKKLLAVSSLQTLAYSLDNRKLDVPGDDYWICPMIDARRMEVYSCFFDRSFQQQSDIKAEIIDADSFSQVLKERPILFIGDGATKCQSVILNNQAVYISDTFPLARYLVKPAFEKWKANMFEDVAYFEPFYLKDFVATVPKNKVLN